MKSKACSEEQTGELDNTNRSAVSQPKKCQPAGAAAVRLLGRHCKWKIAAPVLIALLHILTAVSAGITIASIGYCLFCAWTGVQFSRQQSEIVGAADPTPVSILKPLKGCDPELYEALRSHCLQDYPEFEILFGVSDLNDVAARIVEKLICEFPERKLRLIRCETPWGPMGK